MAIVSLYKSASIDKFFKTNENEYEFIYIPVYTESGMLTYAIIYMYKNIKRIKYAGFMPPMFCDNLKDKIYVRNIPVYIVVRAWTIFVNTFEKKEVSYLNKIEKKFCIETIRYYLNALFYNRLKQIRKNLAAIVIKKAWFNYKKRFI